MIINRDIPFDDSDYGDLNPGDIFKHKENIYIVTSMSHFAVALDTGKTVEFRDSEPVFHINSELYEFKVRT